MELEVWSMDYGRYKNYALNGNNVILVNDTSPLGFIVKCKIRRLSYSCEKVKQTAYANWAPPVTLYLRVSEQLHIFDLVVVPCVGVMNTIATVRVLGC